MLVWQSITLFSERFSEKHFGPQNKMKISILTPDFSGNCFGRAWILAKLLQPEFDIEIVGPAYGQGIWKPLEHLCDFKTKMVGGYFNGRFEFVRLLRLITGDVIFASKPLMTSFGVGLAIKFMRRKPLVLDIDDWEVGFGKKFYDSLPWYKKINESRKTISNLRSFNYSIIFDKLIPFADQVTVSSMTLHRKYKGTIIWHGRDPDLFDPQKYHKNELRKWLLPEASDNDYVIGFVGTPRKHKGVEDLIYAVESLRNERLLLMIVGMDSSDYCKKLKRKVENSVFRKNIILYPVQPFNMLPKFISISDLIVIPQTNRPESQGQTPAKLFDAMAMGKPIIASRISDMPEILEDCGWITDPENPDLLAKIIKHVMGNPAEAIQIARNARVKYEKSYSWDLLRDRLSPVFHSYT